jgi:DNA-binding response OmpR family regulator
MILIVEDHSDTRNALIEFLQAYEFDTIGAQDGIQALELMKSISPYIVILDWHMPKKSGLEVLCEMKKDSRLRRTAVIFYTGDSNPNLKTEALKAGANRVLIKGTDWNILVEEIAELTSVRPDHYQS